MVLENKNMIEKKRVKKRRRVVLTILVFVFIVWAVFLVVWYGDVKKMKNKKKSQKMNDTLNAENIQMDDSVEGQQGEECDFKDENCLLCNLKNKAECQDYITKLESKELIEELFQYNNFSYPSNDVTGMEFDKLQGSLYGQVMAMRYWACQGSQQETVEEIKRLIDLSNLSPQQQKDFYFFVDNDFLSDGSNYLGIFSFASLSSVEAICSENGQLKCRNSIDIYTEEIIPESDKASTCLEYCELLRNNAIDDKTNNYSGGATKGELPSTARAMMAYRARNREASVDVCLSLEGDKVEKCLYNIYYLLDPQNYQCDEIEIELKEFVCENINY